MVFSSFEFLFYFLPLFLAIYYLLPHRYRNACLCVFSLCFYAFGCLSEPLYLLLLLASVLVCYGAGRMVGGCHKHRGLFLTVALILLLGSLFLFKYAGFFTANLRGLFPAFPLLSFVLPIGISFYTFQEISYLVDVYRNELTPEKNLLTLTTYIVMFPQLIAGPIVRYTEVQAQMRSRRASVQSFISGLGTFTAGLGYKVLLANRLGGLWQAAEGIGYESISTPLAWFCAVGYSLQIYFDFYGYSRMAVGLGRMMGFSLPENFRLPYLSISVTEFWRRWHITLGSWFKSYVYIPLGGSRKGMARTVLNLLIVWLLTGLWHGADWNFVLWGLFMFTLISIEKLGLLKVLERRPVFGHLYMLVLIPVSWVLFAADGLSGLWIYLQRLAGFGGVNVFAGDILKYAKQYGLFVIAGCLLSLGLHTKLYQRISHKWVRFLLMAAVFAGSVYCIYMGMNDPFLYFRF